MCSSDGQKTASTIITKTVHNPDFGIPVTPKNTSIITQSTQYPGHTSSRQTSTTNLGKCACMCVLVFLWRLITLVCSNRWRLTITIITIILTRHATDRQTNHANSTPAITIKAKKQAKCISLANEKQNDGVVYLYMNNQFQYKKNIVSNSGVHNDDNKHTHHCFTALWILSVTTRVSQYKKKHSPTHTYHGHQSSLICFLHLLRSMVSFLFNLHARQSIFTISLQVFFGLPLGLAPSTSYSIHFFTQSLSSFCSTCPYYRSLFCCSTEIMSSNHRLSLNPLLRTTSWGLKSHIHLTILISAR